MKTFKDFKKDKKLVITEKTFDDNSLKLNILNNIVGYNITLRGEDKEKFLEIAGKPSLESFSRYKSTSGCTRLFYILEQNSIVIPMGTCMKTVKGTIYGDNDLELTVLIINGSGFNKFTPGHDILMKYITVNSGPLPDKILAHPMTAKTMRLLNINPEEKVEHPEFMNPVRIYHINADGDLMMKYDPSIIMPLTFVYYDIAKKDWIYMERYTTREFEGIITDVCTGNFEIPTFVMGSTGIPQQMNSLCWAHMWISNLLGFDWLPIRVIISNEDCGQTINRNFHPQLHRAMMTSWKCCSSDQIMYCNNKDDHTPDENINLYSMVGSSFPTLMCLTGRPIKMKRKTVVITSNDFDSPEFDEIPKEFREELKKRNNELCDELNKRFRAANENLRKFTDELTN